MTDNATDNIPGVMALAEVPQLCSFKFPTL